MVSPINFVRTMLIQDNSKLIQALQNNDHKIFGNLYDYYCQPLFKNIYRLLPHTEEAEDILQTVFLKLWETRSRIRAEQSVAGWLFTTSFYLTMTRLRNKVKVRLKEIDDEVLGISDGFNEDDHVAPYWNSLNAAINRLPERKRMAFELCKIKGYSYKEAAGTLGIAEDTVKEYVKSAMSILKRSSLTSSISLHTLLLLFVS